MNTHSLGCSAPLQFQCNRPLLLKCNLDPLHDISKCSNYICKFFFAFWFVILCQCDDLISLQNKSVLRYKNKADVELKMRQLTMMHCVCVCLTVLPQEQALHAIHSVVMLVDKDTLPRPEKHPGLQVGNRKRHEIIKLVYFRP